MAALHDVVRAGAGRAGWRLGRPAVTAPIVGATAARHVDDAAGALDRALDD